MSERGAMILEDVLQHLYQPDHPPQSGFAVTQQDALGAERERLGARSSAEERSVETRQVAGSTPAVPAGLRPDLAANLERKQAALAEQREPAAGDELTYEPVK